MITIGTNIVSGDAQNNLHTRQYKTMDCDDHGGHRGPWLCIYVLYACRTAKMPPQEWIMGDKWETNEHSEFLRQSIVCHQVCKAEETKAQPHLIPPHHHAGGFW